MSKSKQFLLLMLCTSSFVYAKNEFDYSSGSNHSGDYTFSSNSQDSNLLSNLLGTAVGVFGMFQSLNKQQRDLSQYQDPSESHSNHSLSNCKNTDIPLWNRNQVIQNINSQRDALLKTKNQYQRYKNGFSRKHKRRIGKRFKAVQAFFNRNQKYETRSYNIFPDARHLLNKHADVVPFETCSGYALQQIVHREFVNMVNELPRTKNYDELANYIIPFADAGVACNKAGYIAYAFYFVDFCWLTVEGVSEGVYNIAQAFMHPIDTTIGMAHGVIFLGKLLGKVGKEALDITTLALCDSEHFNLYGSNRLNQSIAICDSIVKVVKNNPREAYKKTISFGTEWFLFGKCLSSLGKFARYMKPQLINFTKRLTEGRQPELAFAGTAGNELPLIEVIIDELGNALFKAEKGLRNTGNRVRKWMPNCSKIKTYMQKLEKAIPQLERMYDGTKVTIGHLKDIRLKFDFKHVFGIELKHVRGQTKLNGFHFDPLGMLEKSGAIELINVQHGPEGFYKVFVKIGGQVLGPEKTFFPKHWSYFEIMESVMEAFRDVHAMEELGRGTYLMRGFSKSGIEIRAYVNELGRITSWYPYF